MKPGNGERLHKWDGVFLMNPSNNARVFKTNGPIPAAIVIALATGLI
jgi:hypothetical protein